MEDIKEYLRNDNLIIFVGSGVSSYTSDKEDIPVLKEYLVKGLHKCVDSGRLKLEELEFYLNLLDSKYANVHDYLCVSDILLNDFKQDLDRNQNDTFKNWLNETIGNLLPIKHDLVKAIGELACPIFTTNYDLLLEKILNRKPLTWSRYQNDGFSFDDLNNYILHIHGYYQEPESVILSRDNYNELLKNESANNLFKNFIFKKTVLLIGYDYNDPQLANLIDWKNLIAKNQSILMYKLTKENIKMSDDYNFENIINVNYGSTYEHLIKFINHLKPENGHYAEVYKFNYLPSNKFTILNKYLNSLIQEYGTVAILGHSGSNIKLELQKVFVHLKIDPTHPSIKAMKSLAIEEEFKRKFFERNFFTYEEKMKLLKAYFGLCAKGSRNINNLCKNFLIEPWLNSLLDQKDMFSNEEKASIKDKVQKLKSGVMQLCDFKIKEDFTIKDAYNRFKHSVVLGHPGAGKTTLSKWMIINMAKVGLGIENMLNDSETKFPFKLPILVPIWKYIEDINTGNSKIRRKTLLEFICENAGSQYFDYTEDRIILAEIIKESLLSGRTLVILEGLDEIPIYMNRTELINEINCLLERTIFYDMTTYKLSYTHQEQKEICNTIDIDIGNRLMITSRIEGNYVQDINHYVPRLTIEDMSYNALESFCNSYMTCINESIVETGLECKTFSSDQLFKDLKENEDILKLAINPQLASVIASIYHQCDGVLPNSRIDLYQKTIDKMIERLIEMISQLNKKTDENEQHNNHNLNKLIVFAIMQEIAEYLHARSEGLSERVLKNIIKTNLEKYMDKGCEDMTKSIVYLLKVHSGLLTEFGHNSFKFLHRTFQEYLAAMNIIYGFGMQRDEDTIVRNISEKISIPNWRVPLAMVFGMLSKSNNKHLLKSVVHRLLLENEQTMPNAQYSSFIIPYVIVDSINEFSFHSDNEQQELIETLLDKLLYEFKNRYGFSRIKEHQELTRTYFSKLKERFKSLVIEWFCKKIDSSKDNVAACAKLILDLKIYDTRLHEALLNNLHHDSEEYNWPVDAILRLYLTLPVGAKEMLKFRDNLDDADSQEKCFPIILALYGAYDDKNTIQLLHNLNEISSFLDLSDNQRQPFLYYYEEIWGRGNTAYEMAVQADKYAMELSRIKFRKFHLSNIYKESSLTQLLLEHLTTTPLSNFVKILVNRVVYNTINLNEKLDILILLTSLGKPDFVYETMKSLDQMALKYFSKRIEQLLSSLKDSIAKLSNNKTIESYLINSFGNIQQNNPNNLDFALYCKIHLTLIAGIECNPVNTYELVNTIENQKEQLKDSSLPLTLVQKTYFYSEYFAKLFSGASTSCNPKYSAATFSDTFICDSMLFVDSILMMGSCVQMHKPIRSYFWPNDVFIFKKQEPFDVPTSFFNSINNMTSNFSYMIKSWIFKRFKSDALFDKLPELKLIFVLFILEDMSEESNKLREEVFSILLPEINDKINIKELVLEKINADISSPYYKSRSFCMLAKSYDSKAIELLTQAYKLSKHVANAALKFQVLEDILNAIYIKYDDRLIEQRNELLSDVENELNITSNQIDNKYDKIISLVRLVFHGYEHESKINYLKCALNLLKDVENEIDKCDLINKIRPLIILFKGLKNELEEVIETIKDKHYKYFLNLNYGQILVENKPSYNLTTDSFDENRFLYEISSLFTVYASIKEIHLSLNDQNSKDDVWINLLESPHNQTNIEKLIEIGMVNGLIITPQAAIVIDKLISNENLNIQLIFPYLVKPSNEVLPIIYRWFNSSDQNLKSFAALLLCESKWIFAEAVDSLICLLDNENDQLRYRVQNLFQHPERQPNTPEKRISVIGENTILKILQSQFRHMEVQRVRFYLASFFWNLYWDCPQVYMSLYNNVNSLRDNGYLARDFSIFNRVDYLDRKTWTILLNTASTSNDLAFLHDLFQSVTFMIHRKTIKSQDWIEFSNILKSKNVSELNHHIYVTSNDLELITFLIEQATYYIDNEHKMNINFREFIETQLLEQKTTTVQAILNRTYDEVTFIHICNFCVSTVDFNKVLIDRLNGYHITFKLYENLVNWLIYRMQRFIGIHDFRYNNIITACLLSLLAAFVQKDDFIYRKITNSLGFNKNQYIQLLDRILIKHPFFDARGSSFILITALDDPDPRILVNSLNIFLDENLVKDYSLIGIPMVRLSPNDFTDQILDSLKSESAIKVFGLLKIITIFAMNDKIDASKKTRILNFIVEQSAEINSKKPISFYSTDLRIPFSATLENELYKSWLKIQGLSGKTEI